MQLRTRHRTSAAAVTAVREPAEPARPGYPGTRPRAGIERDYQRVFPRRQGWAWTCRGAGGAPLVLDLRLESVTEGVLVTGTVTAPVAGECGRCLTEFTDELGVDFVRAVRLPGQHHR